MSYFRLSLNRASLPWTRALVLLALLLGYGCRAELSDEARAELGSAATLLAKAEELLAQKNPEAAEEKARRSLEIRRRHLGDWHLDVAASVDVVGLAIYARGDFEGADRFFSQVVAIRSAGEEEGRESLGSLTRRAMQLASLGDYETAESVYREALETSERLLGEQHPRRAILMNSFALLFQTRGEVEEAERWFRESLAMFRKFSAGDHPDVAVVLSNLARLAQFQGDYERAEIQYREALELLRRRDQDPDRLGTTLSNLATIRRALGDAAGAEVLHREAVAVFRGALGEEHPFVGDSLSRLAVALLDLGRLDEAEEAVRRTLEIYRQRGLDEDGPRIAQATAGLSRVLLFKGQAREAEALARRALQDLRRQLPVGHWQVASAESGLAACLVELGAYEEAEELLLRSHEVLAERLSPRSPATRAALETLVELYEAWGKPGEVHKWRGELLSAGAGASDA